MSFPNTEYLLVDMSKLSYSRGKYIPINLAVQCPDMSVLDLLLTPRAVSVTLLQCVYIGKNAHSEKHRFLRDAHVSAAACAVWWQSPSSVGEWHDCRTLMGEIALPMRMPVTTVSPRAAIQVSQGIAALMAATLLDKRS
jgi:3-deoxy-D-manno-octulosonic-acid transferase